jgi:type IV pilus assembly protein PilC
MIDAGLPLVQCLELLAKEEPDKRLAAAIEQTRVDVEAGSTLADAMQKRPYAFDALFTNMIAAGEAGGILDLILQRLSNFIEKQAKLVSQVRSAMIYPIAVLSIAAIVVTVIMVKVVPLSRACSKAGSRAAAGHASGHLDQQEDHHRSAIRAWRRRPRLVSVPPVLPDQRRRHRVDATMLRLPMLGMIFKKVAVARFCRTLSTLIGSGVPILDGLEITAKTSGNAIIEGAIRTVRSRIERGETIAAPLRATGIFPPMVVQMIGAGESTGALDAMLGKIADFYEDEVDIAVKGLLTVLEPLLICVLGVIVGGIVISMYLPLFDLINQLS